LLLLIVLSLSARPLAYWLTGATRQTVTAGLAVWFLATFWLFG
jgi:hypothetical protein